MAGVKTRNDARFGKYTLVAKLATGGMGEIFLAKLTKMAGFEKLVVIKRLLPHLAEDAHFVNMLLDEARIAARLSHPNVCQVHDLGEVDGQYYICMEYLEGVPCSELVKRARRDEEHLDIALACAILAQTCEGLHHAHEMTDNNGDPVGLVHRDVSPSNLFATVSGAIKVLDFGVAKSRDARARTHTGALKGKYAYMSPEQVMAEELDRRSDIFSLGIVFFEFLATRRLFWRDSEYKMFQAIAEDPIPDVRDFRPDVPAPLAAVVRCALSRDRQKRFATAADLGAAIAKVVSAMGVSAGNREIAAFVNDNFEAWIRERRDLLVTAVSTHEQPTVADGRADMGEHSTADETVALGGDPNPTPTDLSAMLAELQPGELAPRRRLGPALAIAALVVLLVAGGIVGVKYLGPGAGASAPSPALAAAPIDAAPVAADALGPDPFDEEPPAAEPTPRGLAKPRITVKNAGELFRSINAAGGARCTQLATEDQPAFTLILDIDASGDATSVRIAPRSLRRDRLAVCLGRAARKARFETKDGPYEGRVTVSLKQ